MAPKAAAPTPTAPRCTIDAADFGSGVTVMSGGYMVLHFGKADSEAVIVIAMRIVEHRPFQQVIIQADERTRRDVTYSPDDTAFCPDKIGF